jgi:hypothetical protein
LHGAASAAAYLNSEGFPKFTTVYFNLEPFTNQSQNGQISSVEATYITEWCNDIRLFGYLPGIYFNTKNKQTVISLAQADGAATWVTAWSRPGGASNLTAHSNSNANIFPASPPSLSGVTFATGWQYSGDTYTNNNVDGPVYLDLDTFSPAAQTVALQNTPGIR